jgi:ATP-dependent 26S proteasome regulatory subunit
MASLKLVPRSLFAARVCLIFSKDVSEEQSVSVIVTKFVLDECIKAKMDKNAVVDVHQFVERETLKSEVLVEVANSQQRAHIVRILNGRLAVIGGVNVNITCAAYMWDKSFQV